MKKYLVFAAAAAMFAACSENDVTQEKNVVQQPAEQQALSFEAYTQRGLTRSGWVGILDDTRLKETTANGGGFGVFAYYTNNNQYDAQATPNFMYNQAVTYNETDKKWEYAPIKYWPNEYGNSAISDDQDKVSFFAYAPYVKVTAATGKVDDATWGIVGMNRNSGAGDPIVKYISTFDVDKAVDLCWAVVGKDATAWNTIQSDYTQEMAAGKPWIDVLRPGLSGVTTPDQKLKFTFLHALAKLNVTIDTYADAIAPAAPDNKSKVYVRSITFSGFAQKGALNLNNEDAFAPRWADFNGTNDLDADDEIVIYDGRKDGKEGVSGAVANNEKVLGLNPTIISNDGNTNAGVTDQKVSLFRQYKDAWTETISGDNPATTDVTETSYDVDRDAGYYAADIDKPIYIIPTGDDITVTIVYDIETEDENLPTLLSDGKTYGSSVENRITKNISFGTEGSLNKFEAGKAYVIALHLGMNSVKFDADIKAWEDATGIDVDLPSNLPTYAAKDLTSVTTNTHAVTLPAATSKYKFAISGLNAGESVDVDFGDTNPANDGYVTAIDNYDVLTNGYAIEEATITPNVYVINKTGKIKVVGQASGKGVIILVTQQAAALGLNFTVTKETNTIALLTGKVGTADVNALWDDTDVVDPSGVSKTFKVFKNGSQLTYSATAVTETSADANKYSYDNGTITLGEKASVGDVFTITIEAGDAEEETFTYTVKN